MTTTAKSTEVVSISPKGRLVLKSAAPTAKDLISAIAEDTLVRYEAAEEFPPLPPAVVLTDDVKAALAQVPTVFGKVNMTERRALSEDEIAEVYTEQQVLREIVALISSRDEALKEMIRHHQDVDAEERGVAVPKAVVRGGHVVVEATPRDAKGHYLLSAPQKPNSTPIKGVNKEYRQEYRAGTLTVEPHVLEQMFKDGEISREDYLSFTVERRVFDEAKAMKAMDADESRMGIFQKMISRKAPTQSLFVRKAN